MCITASTDVSAGLTRVYRCNVEARVALVHKDITNWPLAMSVFLGKGVFTELCNKMGTRHDERIVVDKEYDIMF